VIEFIVDASVAVKWFLPEIYSNHARRLRRAEYRLHVPAFFRLEFGNVLCKKLRRGEIDTDTSLAILRESRRLPLRRHRDEAIFPGAFSVAVQTGRSLYDSMHVALAVSLKGPVVTADRRLFEGLSGTPYETNVTWVEQLR
jgi:predicted nucleic acid-binding protein